jgi:hypothetical protein
MRFGGTGLASVECGLDGRKRHLLKATKGIEKKVQRNHKREQNVVWTVFACPDHASEPYSPVNLMAGFNTYFQNVEISIQTELLVTRLRNSPFLFSNSSLPFCQRIKRQGLPNSNII